MKTYKYLLFIPTLLLFSTLLYGQKKSTHIADLKNLTTRLEKGEIKESEYLDSINLSLPVFFTDFKGSLPTDSLINLLKTYKKIAWNDKILPRYRAVYYGHLAVNANVANRGSEAIFFAKKYDQIIEEDNKTSFLNHSLVFTHYYSSKNFPKIIQKFEENETIFYNLFLNQKLNAIDKKNMAKYFAYATEAYIETHKPEKAAAVLDKLRKIYASLIQDKDLNAEDRRNSYFELAEQEINFALSQNNPKHAEELIAKSELYLAEKNSEINDDLKIFEKRINTLKIKYLTHIQNYQKALNLLNSKETQRFFTQADTIRLLKENALLLSKTGNHTAAFDMLYSGITMYEKRYLDLTNEMDALLYAHTEAEFSKQELEDAERVKKVQLYWTLFVGIGLTGLLITSLVLRIRERRKTTTLINQLNDLTEVMIADAREEASKEEKRKLGQDLHDDMSGSLATLMHLIQQAATRTKEKETSENLEGIGMQAGAIYKAVRNKSHFIYEFSENAENDHLDSNIKKIVDTALSGQSIGKEIEIDKNTSILLNTQARIEMLRIVQESMNNILKHAKNVTEVYVFLYQEFNNIVFQIGDNGKTSKSINSTKSGLGLKSIQNRIQSLGGKFTLDSAQGMMLTVYLPLNKFK